MIISKGHYSAEINAEDLDDVQVSISMTALDTCEAFLSQDEDQLNQELSDLRYMIHDYVNYLYTIREEALSYAV